MSKVEEYLKELVSKKNDEEKKCNVILWVLAIIGIIAAVAGIAYAVYRFVKPDHLEDYEDDIEDDFDYDDDFFDEENFPDYPYTAEEKRKYHLDDHIDYDEEDDDEYLDEDSDYCEEKYEFADFD